MKTKIGIPNPCSENWNEMQPTARGAFCGKCQFDVIDFTAMQPEEIRATLKERTGQKTCGHVSTVQMDLVNTDYHVWENQSVSIFRSKFLYACMLAFGFTLFTGCEAPFDGERVGDMEEVIDVGMVAQDSSAFCGDDIEVENGELIEDGMMEIEMLEGEVNEEKVLSTKLNGNIIGN